MQNISHPSFNNRFRPVTSDINSNHSGEGKGRGIVLKNEIIFYKRECICDSEKKYLP